MSLTGAAALLLASTNITLPDTSRPDPDAQIVQSALQLLQEHKGAEALDHLAPLVEQNERQIEAAQAKGLVFCATDMDEAVLYGLMGAMKNNVSVMPASVCDALYYKAYALNDLGRRREGIAVLERLTALAPKHSLYFNELGFAYGQNGKLDQAEASYRSALECADVGQDKDKIKIRKARAWRGLGWVMIERHDWDGATKAYHQSLKFDPGSEVAKHELEFIAQNRKGNAS